jgi:hypothetical protein
VLGAPSAGWAWSHSPLDETPLFYYQGRVEVYLGVRGAGLPAVAAAPSFVILPASNQSFLGQTLHCSEDVSGDGRADLIIGSPFWQDPAAAAPAGVQKGRVDAFYASAAAFAALPPAGALPLAAANFTALGGDQYEWLGRSLAAVANASAALGVSGAEVYAAALGAGGGGGGLHASCRGAGGAAAAEAARGGGAGAALLLAGAPGARRWDGGDLGWASVGALRAYLLPYAGTAAGELYACQARSRQVGGGGAAPPAPPAPLPAPPAPPYPLQPPPLFSVLAPRAGRLGPMVSAKLGAAVAAGWPLGRAGPPMLALSAPALDLCNSSGLIPGAPPDVLPTAAGSVLLFPLSPALRGTLEWGALAGSMGGAPFFTRALLGSALPDARFGWGLGFRSGLTAAGAAAGAQDLLVTAPQFSRYFVASREGSGGGDASGSGSGSAAAAPTPTPAPPGDSGRQAGAVLVYGGGAAAFPAGFLCAAEDGAAWRAEGLVEHGRLGGAWGVVDWAGEGAQCLVLAAPRAALAADGSAGPADYAGALQVYKLPLA